MKDWESRFSENINSPQQRIPKKKNMYFFLGSLFRIFFRLYIRGVFFSVSLVARFSLEIQGIGTSFKPEKP